MKKSIHFAIVWALLFVVSLVMSVPRQSLAQTSPTSFLDDFTAPTLDPAWQVVEYVGPIPRSHGFGLPANHFSLTDNPGFLRYYVDPMTHHQGFLNNYQTTFSFHSCCNHDAGLELTRQFNGEHWILEAKANYNFPTFTNGRGFHLMIYFGDGGAGTTAVMFDRTRDLSQNEFLVRLIEKNGPNLTDAIYTEVVAGPSSDTLFFRLERAGSILSPQWSTDGSTWITAFTKDMGSQLDGLEQRVSISGLSWFNPGGSYAEWDYVKLNASDNTPPLITPSIVGTLGNNGWYVSDVTVNWSVVDNESPILTQDGCGPTTLTTDTAGVTLTCNATSAGGAASQSVTIKIDKSAPTCAVTVTPATLWPPNHKLKNITAQVNVNDNGSGAAGFQLISVTSNEPDNGLGDGDQPSDIQGWTLNSADLDGQVRAERAGGGTGRIYTLTYQGGDTAGNVATCSASVTVPKNQS